MSTAHCWTGYLEWIAEHHGVKHWWQTPEGAVQLNAEGYPLDATCMLAEGHEGPHEFTPDSEIVVEFTDQADPAAAGAGG